MRVCVLLITKSNYYLCSTFGPQGTYKHISHVTGQGASRKHNNLALSGAGSAPPPQNRPV